ncbi:hypothetical protein [Bordetella sp. 02P26C-1]|uniref:hypothetical protein n=1 Tax=Bordetella sp. 02P26C-1 TaxID=2683195 RepID=UPI001355E5CD|nr:hypothetical protein [Bordetella sp. 02P26C-1]MVW80175.1 hypothetical protein [Bordetella sp. 02P26C-1]
MARKEQTITITAEGRDKGKTFVITELSAYDAEDWAGRALFTLMNSGVEIPDSIASAGLAGVAAVGLKTLAKVPYEAAKPLLDRMMDCIEIQPSPKVRRALVPDDIEEVATLLTLRKAVLSLHLDFFTAAAGSTSE